MIVAVSLDVSGVVVVDPLFQLEDVFQENAPAPVAVHAYAVGTVRSSRATTISRLRSVGLALKERRDVVVQRRETALVDFFMGESSEEGIRLLCK